MEEIDSGIIEESAIGSWFESSIVHHIAPDFSRPYAAPKRPSGGPASRFARYAVAFLVLAGCAACDPSIEGRVCLVGDSNSEGLLAPLHFSISAGSFVNGDWHQRPRSDLLIPVASVRGARLDMGLASGYWAGRLATAQVACDQAVISLGANDLGDPSSAIGPALDAEIDNLLGLPELDGVPVLWIAPSPTSPLHPHERVVEWRQALWRAEQRWPLLEVQDAPTSWLSADGVHFTPEGYAQLSVAVADRLLSMVP